MSNEEIRSSDDNGPVRLAVVPTEVEAALIVNALADEGIEARIVGTGDSTGWPKAVGNSQVVVHRKDLTRAQAILAAIPGE